MASDSIPRTSLQRLRRLAHLNASAEAKGSVASDAPTKVDSYDAARAWNRNDADVPHLAASQVTAPGSSLLAAVIARVQGLRAERTPAARVAEPGVRRWQTTT